ncbi:helix-turn-helix domain-containing protein [Humibacter sp.]|uniref:helix-turn-helix domain-containing protein n=1 Tax=Humibacter sp. TaxID=1940291 RepID=UPI003F80B8E9
MNEQRDAGPVFLTSRQVAELLRVPLRTVEDWRLTRTGPPWLKLGRHVRYEQAALLAWVREHQHG